MPDASAIRFWQVLTFLDADTMITWLRAVGFAEHAVFRSDDDPTVVVHAEMVWPGGGGIMFGSHREGDVVRSPGQSSVYLVADDPDATFAAAVEAGGTVLREMVDQDYGGRGGTVADPEGNVWSFGSYQPT